jgi:hypothetical protein
MNLPADLLQAVSAPGGGKITLVVGAGCSLEAPTSIPLAGTCSQECHDRLVADGVLAAGDCPTPGDLSALADAVMMKTGRQRLLVEQLSQNYALLTATPNEGHLIAAALLREGAIASVLTLNFDLALSAAISSLGVGDTVGIINSADELLNQKVINVYYLHRNVTSNDPETWILRTAALATEWKARWDGVVAAKVLAAPVVIFAGLGSPGSVLIESSKLIQKAIPNGSQAYQVDLIDCDKSHFFKELALDPAFYIQAKWCDFMAALSNRLVVEHTSRLKAAATEITRREHLTPENIDALLSRLEDIGLVKLGHLRANWLLHEKPYLPDEQGARELIADLLLAAALVARETASSAVLCEDGVVEFRRGDRIIAAHVFVSGKGSRGHSAIEGELSTRQRRFRGRSTPPSGAIIAGTREGGAAPISAPPNVFLGDTSSSIVLGPSSLPFFHLESLRQDSTKCKQVAP